MKQKYTVLVPPSALQRSRKNESEDEVLLVASVINSTYFKVCYSKPTTNQNMWTVTLIQLILDIIIQQGGTTLFYVSCENQTKLDLDKKSYCCYKSFVTLCHCKAEDTNER